MYPVECPTWEQLLNHAESAELPQLPMNKQGTNYYFQNPLTSMLQLDLAMSMMKRGGFKLAAFGTSMPPIFNAKAMGTKAICTKHAYNPVERVVEVNGSLTTKNVYVPHEGEKQFQCLIMEVTCLVWAQALLGIVYDLIEAETKECGKVPFNIPQLCFVRAAIAIESTLLKRTTFLVEEVIDAGVEGPFRKYINNVSLEPLEMETKEDKEWAKFLAFSQHVQYWKTRKHAFVSDYQGTSFNLCKHSY
jgi:hypothetical protein